MNVTKDSYLLISLFFCTIFLFLGSSFAYGENVSSIRQDEQTMLEGKQGEFLIQYKEDKEEQKSLNLASGGSRKKFSSGVELIRTSSQTEMELLIKELQADKSILYVEKNKKLKLQYIPNDNYYSRQWGLKNIRAEEAWDLIPEKTEAVTVAVIDSGIDEGHPDLVERIVPGGYNFIYHNDNINDINGHGTAVAGIIAAQTNNKLGIAGVANNLNVKILVLKTAYYDGSSYLSDVIEAIDYAIEKEVDIINLSMGDDKFSNIENAAIQRAIKAGIVVIAAAGNESSSAYLYPASYENVISVGAVSNTNMVSYFSNHNDAVDVVAPGEGIYTCKPNSLYEYLDGTSFSAPFVSGIAAVLKAVGPSLSPAQVENIIKNSVTDQGAAGKDNYYGYGVVNFYQAVSKVATVPVKGISLDRQKLDLIIGESQRLNASILPANASNKKISWVSDKPDVATVDTMGIITAVKAGTANIIVITANGGKMDTVIVTVNETGLPVFDGTEWDEKGNVSADKEWTIEFNNPLDTTAIRQENIYITDALGNKIAVRLCPGNEKKLLKVIPEESYQSKQRYYLYISREVRSQTGEFLPASIRMKFTIE